MVQGPPIASLGKASNKWGIPTIKDQKVKFDSKKIIPFNYCMSKPLYKRFVHFFTPDKEFERVWNTPARYIEILRPFVGVFSPDFSIYKDDPLVVQIYNVFRNRMMGAYWQENGLNVIPTVGWSTEESYDFCFEGVEKGSCVGTSTRGAIHRSESKKIFLAGYKEMLKRLEPEKVFIYGRRIKELEGPVVWLPWTIFITEELDGKPIPAKFHPRREAELLIEQE